MSDIIDIGSITKDSVAGLQAGMDIAAKSEAIKHQRQQLEQQRQDFEVKKWHSTWDSVRGIALEADPVIRESMAEDFSKTYGELYGQRPNPALMKAMTKSDRFKNMLLSFSKSSQAMLSSDPEKYLAEVAPELEQAFVGDLGNVVKQLHTFNMEQVRMMSAAAQAKRAQKIADAADARMKAAETRTKIAEANAAAKAGDRITNDKQVMAYTKIIDQTDTGINLLENEDLPKTVQRFNDAQQEFATAITGAGTSALGKLERTEMTSLLARAKDLKQKVTGSPQDAVPQEQWDLLTEMMKEFRQSRAKQRAERVGVLKRSYEGLPSAAKEQERAIERYQEPGLQSGASTVMPGENQKQQQLISAEKENAAAWLAKSIANINASPISDEMKKQHIADIKARAKAKYGIVDTE